jgi:hypothetical protein
VSCDKSFFIFKRFDELAARNLLFMQDELCVLNEKLRALDAEELNRGSPRDNWNLHSRRHDRNQGRKALMLEIRSALKEYRECNIESAVCCNSIQDQKEKHSTT